MNAISLRERLRSRWKDGGKTLQPETPPLVFGHRGCAALALENTIPAFERARLDRVEAVELDVQLSCDGEILVFHDRDLRRLAGGDSELTTIGATEALRIPLHDVDRGFSADGIPRLHDVVETLSPSTYIDIELKSYPNTPVTVPDAIAVAIDRLGIADRVLVSSFDPRQIRRFRAVTSKFAPSLSGVLDGAIYARSSDIPWILHRIFGHLIGEGTIRKPALQCLPRHGCGPGLTIPWTVNSEEIARRLAGHGVAGIISDDPTAIRDALTPPIQA